MCSLLTGVFSCFCIDSDVLSIRKRGSVSLIWDPHWLSLQSFIQRLQTSMKRLCLGLSERLCDIDLSVSMFDGSVWPVSLMFTQRIATDAGQFGSKTRPTPAC